MIKPRLRIWLNEDGTVMHTPIGTIAMSFGCVLDPLPIMKWQKPELKSLGVALSIGCVGCSGGYDNYADSCSKGYQAESACSQGAGYRGHRPK